MLKKSAFSLDEGASRIYVFLMDQNDTFLVVLDERGKTMDSDELSLFIIKKGNMGTKKLVFLIGGAEGFSADVRRAAPKSLAFGAQTWPHRWVRAMLAEQVYRAFTILAGTPYHKA